jgi:hypothetical protein
MPAGTADRERSYCKPHSTTSGSGQLRVLVAMAYVTVSKCRKSRTPRWPAARALVVLPLLALTQCLVPELEVDPKLRPNQSSAISEPDAGSTKSSEVVYGCDPADPSSSTGPFTACASDQGCNSATDGDSYCIGASTGELGASCDDATGRSDDEKCAPGYFCSVSTKTCRRYCHVGATDACKVGVCIAFDSSGQFAHDVEIGLCLEICDPTSPADTSPPYAACAQGQGCRPASTGNSFCIEASTGTHGDSCEDETGKPNDSLCAPGFSCSYEQKKCFRYCAVGASDACEVGRCVGFEPSQYARDIEIGLCAGLCDPADPQNSSPPFTGCPPGAGCTSPSDGNSYCIAASTGKQAADCADDSGEPDESQCAPGYYCTIGLQCFRYCHVGEADECDLGSCIGFSTKHFVGGIEIGGCRSGS